MTLEDLKDEIDFTVAPGKMSPSQALETLEELADHIRVSMETLEEENDIV